jgi:hypothetical protein
MALDGFTEKLIRLKILTNRQSGNRLRSYISFIYWQEGN